MTNEIKEKLVEKTMKDMMETLSGVEKYALVEKIVDLQQRIDKAKNYILENMLDYSQARKDLLDIINDK